MAPFPAVIHKQEARFPENGFFLNLKFFCFHKKKKNSPNSFSAQAQKPFPSNNFHEDTSGTRSTFALSNMVKLLFYMAKRHTKLA